MDWTLILSWIQSICAVLGLVFAGFQLQGILRRRRNQRNVRARTSPKDLRSRASTEPTVRVDRARTSVLAAENDVRRIVIWVGLGLIFATAVFVRIAADQISDRGDWANAIVLIAIAAIAIATLAMRNDGALLAVTIVLSCIELVSFALPYGMYRGSEGAEHVWWGIVRGCIPLASLFLFMRYRLRPSVAVSIVCYSGLTCALLGHWQESIECIVLGMIAGSFQPSQLRRRMYSLGALSLGAAVFSAFLFHGYVSRQISAWAWPMPWDNATSNWQVDRYAIALEQAALWGASPDVSLTHLSQLSGVGWPVLLSLRVGLIPTIAFVCLMLAVLGYSAVRASFRGSPEVGALSWTAAILLLANIGVSLGWLPTYGVVAIPFDGPPSGFVAGAIWLASIGHFISKPGPIIPPIAERSRAQNHEGPISRALIDLGLAERPTAPDA